MKAYVERLIMCGFSRQHAVEVCEEFIRNLPLIDLNFFARSMELKHLYQV